MLTWNTKKIFYSGNRKYDIFRKPDEYYYPSNVEHDYYIVVFNTFYTLIKSLLWVAKCVFKHQDLQMFFLKLNTCEKFYARHNFKWVKI